MPCPTCDHTMHRIGIPDKMSGPVWWCPRCGTIKSTDAGGFDSVESPKLVERCRTFGRAILAPPVDEFYAGEWCRQGIAESINPPDQR